MKTSRPFASQAPARYDTIINVPEIDDYDVELLARFGITSRKDLANQDPFDLNLWISKVAERDR